MMPAFARFFKKFTQCASGISKWEVALLAERRAAIPAVPAALPAVLPALSEVPAALPAVPAALTASPLASPSASIVMPLSNNAWKSSVSEIQPACEGSCTCCGKSGIKL
eukprot:gene29015-32210_t